MRWLVPTLLVLSLSACAPPQLAPAGPSPVASGLSLTAFPSSVLLSGSTSTINIRLVNSAGQTMPGVPVELTTSSGTVTPSSVITGAAGEVGATLTASGPATVRANAAGLIGTVAVTGVAPFSITVAPTESPIRIGDVPVRVTTTMALSASAPPSPSTITITCRAGASAMQAPQGVGTCTYPTAGSYTLSGTASTPTGWTATASTVVVVAAHVLRITTTSVDTTSDEARWSFSVSSPPGTVTYRWDFGDGDQVTSQSSFQTHTYSEHGERRVTVSARDKDGVELGAGSSQIAW